MAGRLFHEILFNPMIVGGAQDASITGGPELANVEHTNEHTGVTRTNVSRYDAQQKITIPVLLKNDPARSYFNNFWRGGYGSAIGFRVRIPFDFTSVDEVFGEGDGVKTDFYLVKTYVRPGVDTIEDVRRIVKPVATARLMSGSATLTEADGATPRAVPSDAAARLGVPAFTIMIDGTPTTGFTVNNTTGKVSFTSAPPNGAILSWSGEFDTPVCFSGNALSLRFDGATEVQNLALRELLPAELGITV